ncbi:hypothetical protein [Endozoicomonas elysicola]|uniref:Uncharacterized protein n=1 Tax=Endozoicomonas elysicola TaxID=305900 RepID=A0A081KAL4_9GAMM|nr:hypothetical protein [Endozoicomonas elysicola]KEI71190.1 hypothetical protein GV64_10950 [Endozoicomonas elysicola]
MFPATETRSNELKHPVRSCDNNFEGESHGSGRLGQFQVRPWSDVVENKKQKCSVSYPSGKEGGHQYRGFAQRQMALVDDDSLLSIVPRGIKQELVDGFEGLSSEKNLLDSVAVRSNKLDHGERVLSIRVLAGSLNEAVDRFLSETKETLNDLSTSYMRWDKARENLLWLNEQFKKIGCQQLASYGLKYPSLSFPARDDVGWCKVDLGRLCEFLECDVPCAYIPKVIASIKSEMSKYQFSVDTVRLVSDVDRVRMQVSFSHQLNGACSVSLPLSKNFFMEMHIRLKTLVMELKINQSDMSLRTHCHLAIGFPGEKSLFLHAVFKVTKSDKSGQLYDYRVSFDKTDNLYDLTQAPPKLRVANWERVFDCIESASCEGAVRLHYDPLLDQSSNSRRYETAILKHLFWPKISD